ncbi:kelch repeat F-box protein [Rhynchospora pubera]|uniref:Kelch repeat F-box protein n=1 Tax=Rhynchospora pubera TaxID=906938 RepID=A0AAV8G1X5_9POAL|nr:kelch repeat F-box protein [Rhynchospora pubera]
MADAPSTRLIPDLPDEISVQIIARIPRSYHLSLCHVSRSWRSLILTRFLVTVRSSLRCMEPMLCLNIRTQTNQSMWLVLNQGRCYTDSLPSSPLPTVGSACVTAGPYIFVLGGSLSGVPSDVVQILDLRIGGQWFLGPRMSTAREYAAASFLNGCMYAIGGCLPSSEVWAESLNPFDGNPQWVPIDSPVHRRKKKMNGCVMLSGQILALAVWGGVAYDPDQDTGSCSAWGPVPKKLDLGWIGKAVVVNDIVYSCDYMGRIVGYDAGMDKWRTVSGIDKNLPKFHNGVTLANLHGVLCVIWKQRSNENKSKEMMVDWVGIRATDFGSEGLHGSILWWETVALGVPCGSAIAHCIVAEF